MSFDRTDLHLDLIREAAENAATFIRGMDKANFLTDARTRHAVAMCLMIIGENAAKLARDHPDFIAAHSKTPWREAIGLRNRIAHGYEDLDFEMMWSTATEYLPAFLRSLPEPKPFDD